MRTRANIPVIVGISLLVLAPVGRAQDEQWLQYHSHREAERDIGNVASPNMDFISGRPPGVKLPAFKAQEQLFAAWPSPMAARGRLWIALDRTGEQGTWDRLFIDSNGNGHLDDEMAVGAYRTEGVRAYFGPVKVVFQAEDGPVTYHLNFRYWQYHKRSRGLHAYSAGWYEGDITVDGVKKHVKLIDHNVNGTFDDKSTHPEHCDRIQIGRDATEEVQFVGNYIEVDGALYRPEIARDGAYMKLAKAENVRFGSVRLPESITEFAASGENGLFTCTPENGVVSLPAGRYGIERWAMERKDDEGVQWKLRSKQLFNRGVFDVIVTTEARLSIGEPIVCRLDVQKKDSVFSFTQSMKGRLGESIEITRNGVRPRAARLHIRSKDGNYDQNFTFKYG